MQAYSDNQDMNGNGFHLLLYISYLAIKKAEEGRKKGGGQLFFRMPVAPTPVALSPPLSFLSSPHFTSSLTHLPRLILPVPSRIGNV